MTYYNHHCCATYGLYAHITVGSCYYIFDSKHYHPEFEKYYIQLKCEIISIECKMPVGSFVKGKPAKY